MWTAPATSTRCIQQPVECETPPNRTQPVFGQRSDPVQRGRLSQAVRQLAAPSSASAHTSIRHSPSSVQCAQRPDARDGIAVWRSGIAPSSIRSGCSVCCRITCRAAHWRLAGSTSAVTAVRRQIRAECRPARSVGVGWSARRACSAASNVLRAAAGPGSCPPGPSGGPPAAAGRRNRPLARPVGQPLRTLLPLPRLGWGCVGSAPALRGDGLPTRHIPS